MSHLHLGSRVQFNYEGATLTGTIFHFLPDISNGRRHAVVEIEHELPGVTHTVPTDELTAAPISPNYIFLSGDKHAVPLAPDDRRFNVALSNMPHTPSVFREHFETKDADVSLVSIDSLRAS